MEFNSFSFLIFFPVVLAVYFVIPRKVRYLWLLAASYYSASGQKKLTRFLAETLLTA